MELSKEQMEKVIYELECNYNSTDGTLMMNK